jgi:7-keto-8-aminopelargonate synthetase-like enzyme
VIPVIVGDSLRAARLSAMLLADGINVQPMVWPAVPNERARLRFFIAATHTERELEHTVRVLAAAMRRLESPESENDPTGAQAAARSTVSA